MTTHTTRKDAIKGSTEATHIEGRTAKTLRDPSGITHAEDIVLDADDLLHRTEEDVFALLGCAHLLDAPAHDTDTDDDVAIARALCELANDYSADDGDVWA